MWIVLAWGTPIVSLYVLLSRRQVCWCGCVLVKRRNLIHTRPLPTGSSTSSLWTKRTFAAVSNLWCVHVYTCRYNHCVLSHVDTLTILLYLWLFLSLGSAPSPLAAYETGPLLVVCPSDQSDYKEMSCDAWFLWKPEAINPTPFRHLQTKPPEIASEEWLSYMCIYVFRVTVHVEDFKFIVSLSAPQEMMRSCVWLFQSLTLLVTIFRILPILSTLADVCVP